MQALRLLLLICDTEIVMVIVRLFALVFCMLWFSANCHARTITVCIPSNPFPPLTFPDHEGQGQWLVRKAVEAHGDTVRFEPVPWKRCTDGVIAGFYEAAMPPSSMFVSQMAFPMTGGEIDKRQSVGTVTMSVLRRVGDKANWNGKNFTSLNSRVLYNRNIVSVQEKLAALGVPGDEGAHVNASLLRKLLAGRGSLLVLNEQAAMDALEQPEYKGKIEKLPSPFLSFTLYVAFNKEFHAANTSYVESIWSDIARQKASPEWTRMAPALAK